MKENGQSLLELIISIGIFIVVISGLVFLILESFISGRLGSEVTVANFLAEEGIEAARSIRDNSWDNLSTGNNGLAISGGNWIFQGTQEDVSSQLREGKRVITIEDIDSDRKKITSKVNWEFSAGKTQELGLITYLTNWQKLTVGYCAGTCTPCNDLNRNQCRQQQGCRWRWWWCIDNPGCTPCENLDQASCGASPQEPQYGCYWTY